MKVASPVMNMPAIAIITVKPEIITARPEVAAATSSARACCDRPRAPRARGACRRARSRRPTASPMSRISASVLPPSGNDWLGIATIAIVAITGEREQQRDARGHQRAERDQQDQQRDRQRELPRAGRRPSLSVSLIALFALPSPNWSIWNSGLAACRAATASPLGSRFDVDVLLGAGRPRTARRRMAGPPRSTALAGEGRAHVLDVLGLLQRPARCRRPRPRTPGRRP